MMSRRRILNASSTKKRDTMIAWTNANNPRKQDDSNYHTGGAVLTGGGQYYSFPWICTARDRTYQPGTAPNAAYPGSRMASTCYMRGLKENVFIQTTGRPWMWRRICVTVRAALISTFQQTNGTYYAQTSNGWSRLLNDWDYTAGSRGANLYGFLFRGAQGIDWYDLMNAPVDTRRMSVRYDKTRILNSNNEEGSVRTFKMWHAMNKNLVFDDDESGEAQGDAVLSQQGNQGMGDYLIVDIFAPGLGSTSSDLLAFRPEATLYWHEK